MTETEILYKILTEVRIDPTSNRTNELASLLNNLCALLSKQLDDEQKNLFSCICDVAENLAALKFDDGAAFGIYAAQHTNMPIINPQAALEDLNNNVLPVSEAFPEATELISGQEAPSKAPDKQFKKFPKKPTRWKNITF